ncbi:MAG: dUTP diphosphatase [Planctomycetaceae bacterium]|nr:dUTP diphosphatase [Planctomycetaceae bacterium]
MPSIPDFEFLVQLVDENAQMPTRGSEEAAGYDVYSIEQACLAPGELFMFDLGFKAAFTPGYGAMVCDRSSTGKRDIVKRAGLLDSDYRGHWILLLKNDDPEKYWHVSPGDRIAQIVFPWLGQTEPKQVDSLPDSLRGTGGFGSTGR